MPGKDNEHDYASIRRIANRQPSRQGMIFMGTEKPSEIQEFYTQRIGMSQWLKQEDCIVFENGNLLIGFCEREKADIDPMITMVFRSEAEVDRMYESISDIAVSEPLRNEKYGIYHFFASDPEERRLEFQAFLNPVNPLAGSRELLVQRRSIRHFLDIPVSGHVLDSVFELCRYSPSSKNSGSYYFIVIENRDVIDFIASLRGKLTAPIGNAPLAVAVCADPSKSMRFEQDACIAAYHLILSAWAHDLGTCWIADMNRREVKQKLEIPEDHYVATVTPLGYPYRIPAPAGRRKPEEFVKRMTG